MNNNAVDFRYAFSLKYLVALVTADDVAGIESLNFSNVKTILFSHPKKKAEDLFLHTAVPCIATDKALCLEAAKPYDYIEITLNGEDILEVLERGSEE